MMKPLFAASLALALDTVLAKPVDLAPRQTTCAAGVHMMIGGGCAVPCASDTPGFLQSLISDVQGAISGSDTYFVPYNNSEQQARVSTPLMIQAATSYAASCPNTSIVMIGYSLGGIVILNSLCGGINPSLAPNIIAAITYGEETYRGGTSYDAGTCTASAPGYPRNNTAQCAPFAASIQDYCDSDDSKCCTTGTNTAAHFEYPARYDQVALAFIEKRYYQAHPNANSGPPQRPPPGSGAKAWLAYLKALAQYYKTHKLNGQPRGRA